MHHPLIVAVDDNTDYLSFITTLLASAGYTVLSCHQSAAAMPLGMVFLSSWRPDVATLFADKPEYVSVLGGVAHKTA